jgi:uncharacterized protein
VQTQAPKDDSPKKFACNRDTVPQAERVVRENVQYVLTIGGRDIINDYQNYVEGITVRESCDFSISTIKITFYNERCKFTDESLWDRGKIIEMRLGYPGTSLVKRGGKFISQGPSIEHVGGKKKIVLIGYSEEMRLGKTEQRVIWQNRRDHEIAQEIAKKNKFGYQGTPTDPFYDHVAQVNESDYKFLDRRARYYGYQVYVEDGILHFHPPTYKKSGIVLRYHESDNNRGNLYDFKAWEYPYQHGKIVTAAQIDPLSKEVFTVTSTEDEDEVTKSTKGSFQGSTVPSAAIASLAEAQPQMFMFEEGHRQSNKTLLKEVNEFSKYTRWLVLGEGSCIARETMKVRTCVELMGLGRDSGEYYINDLTTKIYGGIATSVFKVIRTWRGASSGSRGASQAVNLRQSNPATAVAV